jgi:hypothetical protein
MYKITETELKEIQKLLKEIININGDSLEQITTKVLMLKIKAKKLSNSLDENYLNIGK